MRTTVVSPRKSTFDQIITMLSLSTQVLLKIRDRPMRTAPRVFSLSEHTDAEKREVPLRLHSVLRRRGGYDPPTQRQTTAATTPWRRTCAGELHRVVTENLSSQ